MKISRWLRKSRLTQQLALLFTSAVLLLTTVLLMTLSFVSAATPYLGQKVVNVKEGFRYNFDYDVFGDINANTYSYGLGPLVGADWLAFDTSSLILKGTPAALDLGLLLISILAYNGPNVVHTATLNVKVNSVPTYNGDPLVTVVTAASGNFSYSIEVGTFDDADGDLLAFVAEIENCPKSVCDGPGNQLPDWLTFIEERQEFIGTPTAADRGVYDITVTAEDPFGFSVSAQVTIRLDNDAPALLPGLAEVGSTASTSALCSPTRRTTGGT
jgi:hypothetical protein